MKPIELLLATLPLLGALSVEQVQAQVVTPASDGTATTVTTNGNQLDINGGQTSSDGANLFHSFEQFGLNQSQTANFLSNPNIQNILAKVSGGDASVINGRLQVTGGNANLFLINPSGIIFGANASLNLNGAFTATTANGLGFGSNWLSATGTNNYASLTGTPSAFAFTMEQPGAIVNAGNLSVGEGQNLTLLAGSVANTGELNAPGGAITVAAVPGKSIVRISQAGNVLSLDVQPLSATNSQPNNWTLPILSLPQLLTGGGGSNATGLVVNSNGQVELTGSGLKVDANTGTVIASGSIDASSNAAGKSGGSVQVLGDKVGLIDAKVDASGVNGGGTVLIGGDYQGKGTVPNASHTYVSNNSIITADSLLNGNGGRVIVWANNTTGFYGNITARGGSEIGSGGFVEVSGKENLSFQGTVDTSAVNGSFGTLLLDPQDIYISSGNDIDSLYNQDPSVSDGKILSGEFSELVTISENKLESLTGNVILEATRDIFIGSMEDGKLNFQAGAGESVKFSAGRYFDLYPELQTQGGSINISAPEITFRGSSRGIFSNGGDILLQGLVDGGTIPTVINAGTTGQVQLNGRITNSFYGIEITGSNILASNISAAGDITLNGKTSLSGEEIFSRNGDIKLNGSVTLTGDTKIYNNLFFINSGLSSGGITFNSTVDGNYNLTVGSGGGGVIFNNAVGSNIPLSSLNVSAAFSHITLGGNVATNSGAISFASDESLILKADIEINSFDGDIKFNNSVDSDSSPRSLTIKAGLGNVDSSSFGLSNPLGDLKIEGKSITSSSIRTQGDLVLNSQENLNLVSNKLSASGDIRLLSQNTVQLEDSFFDSGEFTIEADGNLFIQGNEGINIQLIENRLSLLQSDGNTTLISDGLITGNARFQSGGTFSNQNLTGGLGNFRSDLQSLISSTGDVSFGNYEGLALKIESQGSITGGDIKIIGVNNTLVGSDPDIATLANGPALILRAGVPTLVNSPQLPSSNIGGTTFTSTGSSSQSPNISVGAIKTDEGGPGGSVILSAPGSITVKNITSSSNVELTSNNSNIKTGLIDADKKVVLSALKGNIEVNYIVSGKLNVRPEDSGDISIVAGGSFRALEARNINGLVDNQDGQSVFSSVFAFTPSFETGTVTIKTRNQTDTITGKNGAEGGRINIQVGSEIFFVGASNTDEGVLADNISGTAGAITTGYGGDSSLALAARDRPFGKIVEQPVIEIKKDRVDPEIDTNDLDISKVDPEIDTNDIGISTDTDGNSSQEDDNQDPEQSTQIAIARQSQTLDFGILILDKSLVASLESTGHATKLSVDSNGTGQLTGSDLEAEDEEKISQEQRLSTYPGIYLTDNSYGNVNK